MAVGLVLNRSKKVPAEDSTAFGPIAERFRRAGDLERAVALCQEGLRKFPDHLSARVTLGWSLLDLGRYDEAREALQQVLKRAPDNLAAIRGLAELHDRAEHTMMLPMDGPGQWPPDAASIEEMSPEPAAAVAIAAAPETTPHAAAEVAYEFPPALAIPVPVRTTPTPDVAPAASSVPDISLGFTHAAEPPAVAEASPHAAAYEEATEAFVHAALTGSAPAHEPAQSIAAEYAETSQFTPPVADDTALDFTASMESTVEDRVETPVAFGIADLEELEEEVQLLAGGEAETIQIQAPTAGSGQVAAPEDDADEIAALEALIAQAQAVQLETEHSAQPADTPLAAQAEVRVEAHIEAHVADVDAHVEVVPPTEMPLEAAQAEVHSEVAQAVAPVEVTSLHAEPEPEVQVAAQVETPVLAGAGLEVAAQAQAPAQIEVAAAAQVEEEAEPTGPRFELVAQSIMDLDAAIAATDDEPAAVAAESMELPLIVAYENYVPEPEPAPAVPVVKAPILALERFLRRVQLRRLYLAEESVA